MLISAAALLATDPDPSDDAIRDGLAGNLCRCTGYQPIIEAVRRAAAELREQAAPG
jgi:carbon-monoxide dehydrogenase small subunit